MQKEGASLGDGVWVCDLAERDVSSHL